MFPWRAAAAGLVAFVIGTGLAGVIESTGGSPVRKSAADLACLVLAGWIASRMAPKNEAFAVVATLGLVWGFFAALVLVHSIVSGGPIRSAVTILVSAIAAVAAARFIEPRSPRAP